jgi:hypothetical protein
MADASHTEQLAASLPPAYAHVPEEAPPDQAGEQASSADVDPHDPHRLPAAYGPLMGERVRGERVRTDTVPANADGFEAEFPGGTVQISADAMARSADAATADDRAAPPPDETDAGDTDSNDATAEPSSNGDNVTPDLGERVL